MASRRRDLGRPLLVALCMVALFAVVSESHGLEDFRDGMNEATPAMESFFGAKPEAAQLPEALDASNAAAAAAAKPEATTIPATAATTAAASAAPPRRSVSVSVAAGVACGVAAVAVVGAAVAVAYAVRARRQEEVRLGSP
ncbi:hypothetical protein GUJ93_ZPchr0458g22529 [Zizania palustris]|uniref:Uncharacterized protein n=1 Tax=Zizania palustris TaxID=103762 RepID=A0A8J5RD36_ZIZPA|nr:hypothetical protein GUJ93_ZPchr0458g22529 [Zizania palustris]